MTWWIAQHLAVGTALIALVYVLTLAARLGPAARHMLWVIVLIKLVTPPIVVFEWPWTSALPAGLREYFLRASSTDLMTARERVRPVQPSPDVGLVWLSSAGSPTAAPPVAAQQAVPGLGPAGHYSVIEYLRRGFTLSMAWLVGTFVVAAWQSLRIARTVRLIRSSMPADPDFSEQVTGLKRKIGLRRVTVCQSADAASPCIVALNPLRPVLVWPAGLSSTMSPTQQHALIVHELAHVKRLDHLTGWLELIATIVWWWNPLFWHVRNQVRQNAELACDSWVMSELPRHRRAYAETLLSICASAERQKPMHAVGISTASRRFLTRRLTMIMKGTASSHISRLGMAGYTLLALMSVPSWAQQVTINPVSIDHTALPAISAVSVHPIEVTKTPVVVESHSNYKMVADSISAETLEAEPNQTPTVLAPENALELRTAELKAATNATRLAIEFKQGSTLVDPTALFYLDTLFHQQWLDVVSQSLSAVDRLVEASRLKVQAGVMAPIDVIGAEAEQARLRQASVVAQNALRASDVAHRVALADLTNTAVDPIVDGVARTGINRSNFRPVPVDVSVAIIGADATIRQQTSKEATESASRLRSAGVALQGARAERAGLESQVQEMQRQFEGPSGPAPRGGGDDRVTMFQLVQGIRDLLKANDEELQAVLDYRKALIAFDTVIATARSDDPNR
jgi:beta-lactamase regulating signal transducer with metallopeptidase domain